MVNTNFNNSIEKTLEIPKPITNKEAIGVDADDDAYLYQCIKFNLTTNIYIFIYKVAEYKKYISSLSYLYEYFKIKNNHAVLS